jgi:acetyl-CoA carboxylase biotin carboxyl carrier protein
LPRALLFWRFRSARTKHRLEAYATLDSSIVQREELLARGSDHCLTWALPQSGDDTLELKDIKAIIDLMKKNDLAVFKLEKEGFKLELEAHPPPAPLITAIPGHQVVTAAPVQSHSTQPSSRPSAAAAEEKPILKEIASPMVGTFYRAPSPDSAPYVQEGQHITEETVVCIIEAMKVMNEIKAEVEGVITEVLAENGTAVQFGQPLFRVK